MSAIKSQNKKTRWASLLQLFCIPSSNKEEKTASTSELSHEKLSMNKAEVLTPRTSIVYDKPLCQPRPSSAPENTSQQPQLSAPAPINGSGQNGNMLKSKFSVRRKPSAPLAETLDHAQAAPIPAPISPVEPKKCHRRWSSASMHRPAVPSSPEATLRRSATTVIKVGLLTDGPIIQPQTLAPVSQPSLSSTTPAAAHISSCVRASEKRLPPRPPTPPFSKVKMEDIPLPPPLPAIFKSTSIRKKSLSGVSHWLFHNTAESQFNSAPELLHPKPVRAAIFKCFAAGYNGSNMTINTLGLGDRHGVMSPWSPHTKEAVEAEFFELILENKTYAPVSGVARAA